MTNKFSNSLADNPVLLEASKKNIDMLEDEKYEQPEMITDEDGWRFYKLKGQNYLSVTTILDNAVANPKLANWFKKNSENKIARVKSETGDFGSQLHSHIEDYLIGKPSQVEPQFKQHMENFKKWATEKKLSAANLKRYGKGCEVSLVSKKYGFAGTADFIGWLSDKPVIADWKTSRMYRVTFGWQLAAYRLAAIELELVNDKCGLLGLQISRETAEVKSFEYQHIDFVEFQFLAALEIFKGLYFNKLAKMNWPWLKERSLCLKK